MEKSWKKILCITLLFYAKVTFGQESVNNLIKSTDSLRSKKQTSLKTDLLPEVLQTVVNNGIISSSETGMKLNTTIYGIKKIINPNINIDTNYVKQTFNRNFSFGGGININDLNKINGFQTSIKWAIVNNRDLSIINKPKYKAIIDTLEKRENDLVLILFSSIASAIQKARRAPLPLLTKSEDSTIDQSLSTFGDSSRTENAAKNLKKALQPFIIAKKLDIDTSVFDLFSKKNKIIIQLSDSLENLIKKRGILTFSANSNYVNKNWDSVSLKFEWIKGIGGKKDSTKPWDLYAGAFFNFKKDTLSKQTLERHIGTLKFGVNKVLAVRDDGSPFFEVLGTMELDNILSGSVYANEKRNTFFADFIFTIRVSKAVSIPLEIKYDVNNKGNLFGFLNLKWDILTSASK